MTEIEKKELPKVLVGLATHESKGYVLDEFLLNVSRFTYQHFDIYICDNSRTEKYSNEIIYKAKELNLDIIVDHLNFLVQVRVGDHCNVRHYK